MRKRLQISYNTYFLIPFALWVILGGILSLVCNRQTLFQVVNGHYTDVGNVTMYYITMMGQAEVIIPVLTLLMVFRAYRTPWYFITAVLCNVLPLLINQGLKSWYELPRPMSVFHDATWVHIMPDWPVLMARSFPSGHSQGAFSFFCFLALLLTERYKKWGLLFFTLAMLVCYSRLYLAAHFFADVYVGSIVGTVVTTITFTIMAHYKWVFNRKNT